MNLSFIEKFADYMFAPIEDTRWRNKSTLSFILFLFVFGIIHWIFFLKIDEATYYVYDWPNLDIAHSIIINAIRSQQIPYLVTQYEWSMGSDRFLALPFTLSIVSPQVLLLFLFQGKNFILANTLLLFSIGFIGTILLSKKYAFSPIVLLTFYALYNFNGYLISHIAVGHYEWIAYFWLPFFIYYVLEILNENVSYKTSIKLALVMMFISLQGAMHMFVWCLFFLGFMFIFNQRNRVQTLLAMITSGLLASMRILPAILQFTHRDFIGGYPSIDVFLTALLSNSLWTWPPKGILYWWEFDIFISVIGLAFILYFGIYRQYKENGFKLFGLDFPILIMLLLSFSNFYHLLIVNVPLPGINLERVASRFIIIPFLFLLFRACQNAQKMILQQKKINNKLAYWFIGADIALVFLLVNHSRLWRVENLQKAMPDSILTVQAMPTIISHPDSVYIMTVNYSYLAFALILFTAILSLIFHGKRSKVIFSLGLTASLLAAGFSYAFPKAVSQLKPTGIEVSSVNNSNPKCFAAEKVVDGFTTAYTGIRCFEWATNGELDGAWIRVNFKPREVYKITLFDRVNLVDHVLAGKLELSDGSVFDVGELPNDGSGKSIFVDSKSVEWVLFKIIDAEGLNIGLAEIQIN